MSGAEERYQRSTAPNHRPEIGGLAAMADIYSIDPDRFWKSVRKGNGCWEWTGYRNYKGYGEFNRLKAHRIAFTLTCGPIPLGMLVCHHCDVPWCCNPTHLFLGTNADNQRDMYRKGRGRKATR